MSSHSTPQSSKSKSKSKSKAPTSSVTFTPRMQDAQARDKDPDPYASDSSDSPLEGGGRRYDRYGQDSYHQIQQRREAAIILDSPELLMMHAQARNDSIPGTRHYFTKMLCGYLEKDDAREKEKRELEADRARRVRSYKGSRWEQPS